MHFRVVISTQLVVVLKERNGVITTERKQLRFACMIDTRKLLSAGLLWIGQSMACFSIGLWRPLKKWNAVVNQAFGDLHFPFKFNPPRHGIAPANNRDSPRNAGMANYQRHHNHQSF